MQGRAVVLGFRVEPGLINWAAVEGTRKLPILITAGEAPAPAIYDEPDALGWFRQQVCELIESYSATVVAVRYPETVPRQGAIASAQKRSRVEGVVIEASRSMGCKVLTGALATISKNLGTKPPEAKQYLMSNQFRGLDWSDHTKNRREAILVAASALPT